MKELIRAYKQTGIIPIWRAMPISKCWIGLPTVQYVIWWGNKIVAHSETYRGAIMKRRQIWNKA